MTELSYILESKGIGSWMGGGGGEGVQSQILKKRLLIICLIL